MTRQDALKTGTHVTGARLGYADEPTTEGSTVTDTTGNVWTLTQADPDDGLWANPDMGSARWGVLFQRGPVAALKILPAPEPDTDDPVPTTWPGTPWHVLAPWPGDSLDILPAGTATRRNLRAHLASQAAAHLAAYRDISNRQILDGHTPDGAVLRAAVRDHLLPARSAFVGAAALMNWGPDQIVNTADDAQSMSEWITDWLPVDWDLIQSAEAPLLPDGAGS